MMTGSIHGIEDRLYRGEAAGLKEVATNERA